MKVGFAVITYKRRENLNTCLEHIVKFTPNKENYKFAIFDDGSDYTIEPDDRFEVFQGKSNRGVVVNKNRALYYFTVIEPVDVIIMLEDDTQPDTIGWEEFWIKSTLKFGHMNYAMPSWPKSSITTKNTKGTWNSPHGYQYLTGQVHGLQTKHVKTKVGYLNPNFEGYGWAHVEWTRRFISNRDWVEN